MAAAPRQARPPSSGRGAPAPEKARTEGRRLTAHAARALACGLALATLPGCAAFNRYVCKHTAERRGIYLGQRYTGTSCSTYTTKGRHGGRHTTTNCSPDFEEVWQWTPESQRYYDRCLAEVAAGRSPPDPDEPPPPPRAPRRESVRAASAQGDEVLSTGEHRGDAEAPRGRAMRANQAAHRLPNRPRGRRRRRPPPFTPPRAPRPRPGGAAPPSRP